MEKEKISYMYYNLIPRKQRLGFLYLLNFLKERGIYDKFFVNLFHQREKNNTIKEIFNEIDLFVYMVDGSPYEDLFDNSYINKSFQWMLTPQGHDYWRLINDEFIEYISEVYGGTCE